MKKTLTIAIVLLCIINLTLLLATIKAQNEFSAQLNEASRQYQAKVTAMRKSIGEELKGKYKEEIERFAAAFNDLRLEMQKRKVLEELKPKIVKNKKAR